MPHDIHGRKIEKGDVVAAKVWPVGDRYTANQVLAVQEGTDTCNLSLASFEPRMLIQHATASETELLLKADGSKPEALAAAKVEG
jgi:hypothetical protein